MVRRHVLAQIGRGYSVNTSSAHQQYNLLLMASIFFALWCVIVLVDFVTHEQHVNVSGKKALNSWNMMMVWITSALPHYNSSLFTMAKPWVFIQIFEYLPILLEAKTRNIKSLSSLYFVAKVWFEVGGTLLVIVITLIYLPRCRTPNTQICQHCRLYNDTTASTKFIRKHFWYFSS